MDYLHPHFQHRTWIDKKVPAKKEQKDVLETPLFGQQRRAYEEQQGTAQGALFPIEDTQEDAA